MNALTSPSIANYIDIRPNRDGQMRAFVAGTRIRIQDVALDYERQGLTPDDIVREYPQLSLAQVHAALAFYYDHRDEIRSDMKTDEDYARRVKAELAGRKNESPSEEPGGDSHSS